MTNPWARWGIGLAVGVAAFLYLGRSWPVLIVVVVVIAFRVAVAQSKRKPTGRTHLVFSPASGAAMFVILVSLSAHFGGSPLGLFLCFATVVSVALDLAVAAHVTGRVSATLSVNRTEVYVGDEITATMAVTGPHLPVTVKLGPSPTLAADPAADGPLVVSPSGRCVIAALPLEVRSTGLCGLIGLVRQTPVVLSQRVYAGPRPLSPQSLFPEMGGTWGDGVHLASPAGDVVRGVRDYVPGDRRSQVHWRASARSGKLVVKEVEEPFTPVVVLLLDLGYAPDPAGERAAARAAWYLGEGLRRGAEMVLVSWEGREARTARIGSTGQVIRRLAVARCGPPLPAPPAPPGGRILRVGPEGDRWS